MGKSAIVFKVMVTLRFYLEYIFIGAWTERKRGEKKAQTEVSSFPGSQT